MIDLDKMDAAETDQLVSRYETGEELSNEEVDYLRRMSSSFRWNDMRRVRAGSIRKPMIDGLKAQFPEGEVVYLKTGSPKLIVEWTRDDGFISVVWFNDGAVNRDAFHPSALVAERSSTFDFKKVYENMVTSAGWSA